MVVHQCFPETTRIFKGQNEWEYPESIYCGLEGAVRGGGTQEAPQNDAVRAAWGIHVLFTREAGCPHRAIPLEYPAFQRPPKTCTAVVVRMQCRITAIRKSKLQKLEKLRSVEL